MSGRARRACALLAGLGRVRPPGHTGCCPLSARAAAASSAAAAAPSAPPAAGRLLTRGFCASASGGGREPPPPSPPVDAAAAAADPPAPERGGEPGDAPPAAASRAAAAGSSHDEPAAGGDASAGSGSPVDDDDDDDAADADAFAALEAATGLEGAHDDAFINALRQSRLPGNPFGLPPLSEILSFDPEARAKALRRDFERTKQAASAAARVRTVDAQGRAYATGKRKEAIAKVWLWPAPGGFGTGGFLVNRRPLDVYFPVMSMRAHLLYPLVVTGSLGNVCGRVDVSGGGPSGQAQAARHGVAKALQAWDPDLRPPLKAAGLLTRDSRVVERKKPGKRKARASYQWVKR